LLGELPTVATVTPATLPLVSMMQKAVPCARDGEVSNSVPVVHAEYVGVEPLGRLIIFSELHE
jgi:hypothetical protein